MKRPLAFVYVCGLFLLGLVIGAMAMHLYYAAAFPPPPGGAAHRHGPPRERPFSARLERELGLTAEQKQRIDEIIERGRSEAHEIREELRPRVEAHMQRTHERILEVLTPEQRERFEQLHDRHSWRSRRYLLGREPAPHRPPDP